MAEDPDEPVPEGPVALVEGVLRGQLVGKQRSDGFTRLLLKWR